MTCDADDETDSFLVMQLKCMKGNCSGFSSGEKGKKKGRQQQ